jgi:uncharacterized membrane protein YgdD (TMEM256/DUF423 family)
VTPRAQVSDAVDRVLFLLGALSAGIGVGLGAFAAHGLRGRLEADMLNVFETGVRYQMYHALALLAVAWASARWPGPASNGAGWCFVMGTVLFSGSLYLLSLTGHRWLGAITPFGGLFFIAGWLLLVAHLWRVA